MNQTKVLRKKRRLWDHWLYIAALQLNDGTLLVVATQLKPKSAIADYVSVRGLKPYLPYSKCGAFALNPPTYAIVSA